MTRKKSVTELPDMYILAFGSALRRLNKECGDWSWIKYASASGGASEADFKGRPLIKIKAL